MQSADKDDRGKSNCLLNIAPARHEVFAEIARILRANAMWEPLCRAALWQESTREGTSIHSEDSAVWAILDHLMEPEHEMVSEREALIEAVSPQRIRQALQIATRAHLSMSSWCRWKYRLDIEFEAQDNDHAQFADGWVCRLGVKEDSMSQRRQGEIPHTEPDEHVYWAYDESREDICPIPY